ncbi:Metal tolerance protein [Lachnellula suecica]|uniref:Metal tolerance protein n=1 Tax=Lachnellula suecica TaxID=602035 RepID=A0A8T9C355_9HELO|nr:Metal tolerance protein [Lachnellula suecica]
MTRPANVRTETIDPTSLGRPSQMMSRDDSTQPSFQERGSNDDTINTGPEDPYSLQASKREDISKKTITEAHPGAKVRKIKKYYNRQNALIDAYLGSSNEEALEVEDTLQNGGKVKLAIYGSFGVNFFLFIIQVYAAVSTGSLSLFGTAADAFMDLVSSIVMLVTSKIAAKPNVQKFPVGRKRVETVGIILFCALMTTVSTELIIESARSLAAGPKSEEKLEIVPLLFVGIAIFSKGVMFLYCFSLRRYPAAAIFMLDHRNDIVVNIFGLVMSIVGTRFAKVWFLDPTGAICIACLILFSWASTAFEHMWYLVGKTAPQDFLNKLVYVALTHDSRVLKIDTARAYHAGDKYYVEVDIVMGREEKLQITHDVAQSLQRKLEGLADVERAFVHVDYDGTHDVSEEHKPLYKAEEAKEPLIHRVKEKLGFKTKVRETGSERTQEC